MPLQLPEDEIDDLLYFARVGELQEFHNLTEELCKREKTTMSELLLASKDPYGDNGPVHMAAANGHTGTLAVMIKALSKPSPQNAVQLSILNAQNAAGNTALHWAALNGHLECVKLLLDSGADPTITNHAGHDALYEAELNDKREVVEWVLREGGEGLEEGIGRTGEGEGAGEGVGKKEEEEGDEDMGVEGPELEREGDAASKGETEEAIRAGMSRLGVKDGIESS